MIRVIVAPQITFLCDSCGATNEGDPEDFAKQEGMPPSWLAKCGFCGCIVRCFPPPLMSKAASETADAFVQYVHESWVRKVMES